VTANPSSSSIKETKDRRWKRVPLDVRVKAIIVQDERKTVVYGRSIQLSIGGMGVTMTREMPKGTVATLIFKLPGDEDERTFEAEVRYRKGFRCGFEFLMISAQTRQELLRFCMQAAP
jgi:c-di-GMP-binding flagellar brake protein YcgR